MTREQDAPARETRALRDKEECAPERPRARVGGQEGSAVRRPRREAPLTDGRELLQAVYIRAEQLGRLAALDGRHGRRPYPQCHAACPKMAAAKAPLPKTPASAAPGARRVVGEFQVGAGSAMGRL